MMFNDFLFYKFVNIGFTHFNIYHTYTAYYIIYTYSYTECNTRKTQLVYLVNSGLREDWSQAGFLNRQEDLPHRVSRSGPGSGSRGGDGDCVRARPLGHIAEHTSGGQVAVCFGEKNGRDIRKSFAGIQVLFYLRDHTFRIRTKRFGTYCANCKIMVLLTGFFVLRKGALNPLRIRRTI